MALLARSGRCWKKALLSGISMRSCLPAMAQRSYAAGIDDVLFGLTEDQMQVSKMQTLIYEPGLA